MTFTASSKSKRNSAAGVLALLVVGFVAVISGCGGSSGGVDPGADFTPFVPKTQPLLYSYNLPSSVSSVALAPNGDMYAVAYSADASATVLVRVPNYGRGTPGIFERHPNPQTVTYFLAFSAGTNHLYVVGSDNTARVFTPDGQIVQTFTVDASWTYQRVAPIAVDSRGYLYITGYASVHKYAPDGSQAAVIDLKGSTPGAVAVDNQDRLCVPLGSLAVFDAKGNASPSIPLNTGYNLVSFLTDPAGNFYEVTKDDTFNDKRLTKWDSAGNLLYDSGEYLYPESVFAVDDQQQIYSEHGVFAAVTAP